MRDVWDFLKRHLPTLFSVVGIILTVYFAVVYIPKYITESEKERVKTVNKELIESVQELIYNGQEVDIRDLKSLIKTKEIRHDISYPYTIEELLSQSKANFLENMFIPLEERTNLSTMISAIIERIKQTEIAETSETNGRNGLVWVPAIASSIAVIIVVIIGLLGLYSIVIRAKRDKEIEAETFIDERRDEIAHGIRKELDYQLLVREVLNEITTVSALYYPTRDLPYDFEIMKGQKQLLVFCKYSTLAIPENIIRELISISAKNNKEAILVTNVILTKRAEKALVEHNEEVEHDEESKELPIHIIIGNTIEELRQGFQDLL